MSVSIPWGIKGVWVSRGGRPGHEVGAVSVCTKKRLFGKAAAAELLISGFALWVSRRVVGWELGAWWVMRMCVGTAVGT